MRAPLRRLLAVAGVVSVAVLMSACATGAPGAAPSSSPDDATQPMLIDAAWLDGGRHIGVVSQGSSTCVPTTDSAEVQVDGTLAVTFAEPDPETPCTADYAPRVSLVEVPAGVNPAADLEIVVTGAGVDGSATLAGVSGLSVGGETDYLPSAGWTSIEGTFAVLLWGSSGCKEYITSTSVTGDASVTASLSGIPADKVCTADIAPNAVLAFADGLAGAQDVELTLTSAGAEPVTVPIIGVNAP